MSPPEVNAAEPLQRRQRVGLIVLILVPALLAAALELFATARYGPGLSPDSQVYLQGARRLAAGQGFTQIWPSTPPRAMAITWYPPAYSAVLALGARLTGADAVPVARYIAVALLAGCVALGTRMAWRVTRSLAATAVAAVLIALAPDQMEVFAYALSEPLFIAAVLVALSSIALYLERSSVRWLAVAAVAAGLAAMTRYVGAMLPALGTVLILVFSRRARWPARLRDAVLFAALSAAPAVAWMARNRLAGGSASGRRIEWHPARWSHVRSMSESFAQWLFPGAAGLLWWVAMLIVAGILWQAITRHRATATNGYRPPALVLALFAFVVTYVPALMLSISLVDAATPMDYRTLAPLFIPMLVLGVYVGHALWHVEGGRGARWTARGAVGALALVMLVTTFVRTPAWVWRNNQTGARLTYASKRWSDSRAMRTMRILPRDVPIWTNASDATYLRLGRVDRLVPAKYTPDGARELPQYRAAIDDLRATLLRDGGTVAYFRGVLRRSMPRLEDLDADLTGLERIDFRADAVLFADPATAKRLRARLAADTAGRARAREELNHEVTKPRSTTR